MAKKYYSFMVDEPVLEGLRTVKKQTGISESQQIRKGIEMWLQSQGIRVGGPERFFMRVVRPTAPGDREGRVSVDFEASRDFGVDELEILLNQARHHLEELERSPGAAYSWRLQPAEGGGFVVVITRGRWHFVVGPLDVYPFTLVTKAKEEIGAGDERIEVDPRVRRIPRRRRS